MKHTITITLTNKEENLVQWLKMYEDSTSDSMILKSLLKDKLEEQLEIHKKDLDDYKKYIDSKGWQK